MERNSNTSITVGTDPTVASIEKGNQNGRRVSIILINTSTGGQVISLALGSEAAAGQGIVLSPGGSWMDSMDGGYYPTQQQVTAVSSLAGGTLAIQERIGGM